MADILTVRDLAVSFAIHDHKVMAVRDVSFRVPERSTVALVGESGSGKSTVAQAILGILPRVGRVEQGQILFADPRVPDTVTDLATLNPDSAAYRAIRGGQISIIFQEPMTSLSPVHTIGDQVGEALLLHRDVNRQEGEELTVEMLRLVGFPDPPAAFRAYPFELSGGLRQRAMIAMALICRPAILIADEPTTALDVTIQAQILKLIRDLQAELDMSVLIITHDLGVVANLADQVVVMYHGEVMESGPTAEIFADPRHPYLKALFTAVPRGNMKPGERLTPIREIAPGEAPHLRRTIRGGRDRDAAGPLLRVEHLTKRFKMRKQGLLGLRPGSSLLAVDDVSFEIAQGECFGLVGESGCGKTTTSKIIMRALSADDGAIRFNDNGREVDVLALAGAGLTDYRRKVQFIFQDPYGSLNPRMTALDIISEPLVIHEGATGGERAEIVKELMNLVGLDIRYFRRYPHSFSGGQRQRLGIARALALRPELLICDEPVSALDVSIQAQILNLLKDLQEELGLTYLFISHNLAVVDYMADRIAVMCRGRLVEVAPRAELFAHPVHPYTRTLLQAVPYPDPSRQLDFDHLMASRLKDGSDFPAPFTLAGETPSTMIDIGGGHFVRVLAGTTPTEIAA